MAAARLYCMARDSPYVCCHGRLLSIAVVVGLPLTRVFAWSPSVQSSVQVFISPPRAHPLRRHPALWRNMCVPKFRRLPGLCVYAAGSNSSIFPLDNSIKIVIYIYCDYQARARVSARRAARPDQIPRPGQTDGFEGRQQNGCYISHSPRMATFGCADHRARMVDRRDCRVRSRIDGPLAERSCGRPRRHILVSNGRPTAFVGGCNPDYARLQFHGAGVAGGDGNCAAGA